MKMPFPKIHVAESVLNRILNAVEGEDSFSLTMMDAPDIPDPSAEGAAIEESVATPAPPAGPAPDNADAMQQEMVATTLQGGSPFDGALLGALQP